MNNKKLVGIFSTESAAINAIKNLKQVGYEDDEISVIAKKSETVDKIKELEDVDINAQDDYDKAAGGAVAGGVIGGAGALLLELGVFAIPGVGPFVAAGPIATTLGGLVAGGAIGGAAGALVDAGIDKQEAEEYETYLERGDILVAVDERDPIDPNEVYSGYYDNESVIRDRYDIEGMY